MPARRGVAFLGVLALGVAGVVTLLDRWDTPPAQPTRCSATVGDTAWHLAVDQSDNAALIGALALRRGLPARAVTIGLATALQESKLRNIDYGDRDSLGLFQQRPSQGWGTPEQVQDPVYATSAFYDGLERVADYPTMAVTEAAQAVQRSAFPDAYAQHEPRSRAFASALTGYSPGALTCTLPAPAGAGDPAAVVERIERDLGALRTVVTTTDDGSTAVRVDAAGLGPAGEEQRLAWAVAQWAVATADGLDVTAVATADQVWHRGDGTWTTAPEPQEPGTVLISLAG